MFYVENIDQMVKHYVGILGFEIFNRDDIDKKAVLIYSARI